MSDRDSEDQVAETRFARELRRQFEALGKRAPEPRKRRHALVVAAVVVVAVAIATGGIALAGGFHSDSPPQPLWPAATPGGSPQPGVPATSVYPTNANGQTYGPMMPHVEEPDLVRVTATNGKLGYVLRADLEGSVPTTPEEALSQQIAQAGKNRVIPVYQSDGITKIGVFIIAHAANVSPAPSD
jgi:hypothetical protein